MPDEQKPDRPESGGQQNKKKKNQESNRFKGFIDGLEQSVFDTQVNARNADAFNTSMRWIAEHTATGMTGPTADKKQAEPRSRSYSANAPRQYGQE